MTTTNLIDFCGDAPDILFWRLFVVVVVAQLLTKNHKFFPLNYKFTERVFVVPAYFGIVKTIHIICWIKPVVVVVVRKLFL